MRELAPLRDSTLMIMLSLKSNLAGVVIMAVSLAAPPASTAQSHTHTKQKKPSLKPAKTVTGVGCVGPGVEARCVLLTDAATHTLYNLYFTGKEPLNGSTIRFVGKTRNGPTTCMQGQPVSVTKWTKLDNSCSTH